MSWMAKLYETYDNIADLNLSGQNLLWPISHFVKNAHVEVVIDSKGNFLKGRSQVLHGDDAPTLIPATEFSAGRSGSKIAPHPLCEEIGYCVSDRPGASQNKVHAYMEQIRDWAGSCWSHPKIKAVLSYLEKNRLWEDLCSELEFPIKRQKADGKNEKISAEKVFLRWRIEEPGNPISATWDDKALIQAWIGYDQEKNSKEGFCYITGGKKRRASNHPRFLRWPGDGAKLISSNDHSGFTFRGKFTDSKKSMDANGIQAAGVSFEVTQKAHNALRWLIRRPETYKNGEQVYVAWAISGKQSPALLSSSWELFAADLNEREEESNRKQNSIDHSIDLGSSFAQQLKKFMQGYRAKLEPNEQIVVMGLNSATPGRMGIIYYRELLASEFLGRIEAWHNDFAWPQRHTIEMPNQSGRRKSVKKTVWPVSSPAPRRIVEVAYGDILKSNKTLKKSAIERILPCIVDGRPFPLDIMLSAVRRVCNRNNCEQWEWERNLGVACALFKGFYLRHPDITKRRLYAMTLEEDRTTRDYLYGRLLAIAEKTEEMSMIVAQEKPRQTVAGRLMQRFVDRPYSTWLNIEKGIGPYQYRLKSNIAPLADGYKRLLDDVCDAFNIDEFKLKEPLSGEFLLGFHSQRKWLREHRLKEGEWVQKEQDEKFESDK